jgi:adenine-specific DNA-methyltransferase
MRFIGSKQKLLPFIRCVFAKHITPNGKPLVAGDLFCGTAAVSQLLKQEKYSVIANDNLRLGYVLAHSKLSHNSEPEFERLFKHAGLQPDAGESRYETVLRTLNALEGREGFFFREYSPHDEQPKETQRLYFTNDNARKIDGVRSKLAEWEADGMLTEGEVCLLKADLMRATNRIANISGTYGFFNKTWDARTKNPLCLSKSVIVPGTARHKVYCEDANRLAGQMAFDVAYLDPPYTWRHYGAYYHILETIALGDNPPVAGKSGLRPWESTRSPYCEPKNAASALTALLSCLDGRHIFLSYNSEGLISHEEIIGLLRVRGEPITYEVQYRRYLSNRGGTREKVVRERLYYVKAS